jgi:hypothetical protein
MIGSASTAAWMAWRMRLSVMMPCLVFSTTVTQPYGFTTTGSTPGAERIRSYWSGLICWM